MKTRATLALAVVAGLPAAAAAQEVVSITYSWVEVLAGTTTPVPAGPARNSIVETGEGARIRLGVTALINGSNAVGQTIAYTNPSNGIGTVRGLGTVTYDLVGDLNAATANGAWSSLLGADVPFTNGQTGGTAQPGGSSVFGMGGSQFIGPGGSVNNTNNNVQVFRGVWTPASYANRTVNWKAGGSSLAPAGQGNSVLLAYGLASTFNAAGDPITFDQLVGKYIGVGTGNGLNIPIAPAPSSLALLGLGALVAGGRRR